MIHEFTCHVTFNEVTFTYTHTQKVTHMYIIKGEARLPEGEAHTC